MNKNIIIASAVTAGAAALLLLLKKRRDRANTLRPHPVNSSGHLTETFAKAKPAGQENQYLDSGI